MPVVDQLVEVFVEDSHLDALVDIGLATNPGAVSYRQVGKISKSDILR